MTDNKRLKNVTVTVKAPATSANLGGGFDCLGLAVKLYHTASASPSNITTYNGAADGVERNLIYKAMKAVFERVGIYDAAVKIESSSDIPRASGLGSSAACIVAGVTMANNLIDAPLSCDEINEICSSLDGHPDNVLPAIFGGITAGIITDDKRIAYIRAAVSDKIKVAVATPDFSLRTEAARKALPDTYSREDCVYSLSRAVLAFQAIACGDIEKIKFLGDRLHEPYRIPLIKGFAEVKRALMSSGAVNVCVSGAGPTAIAFYPSGANISAALPDGWTLRTPEIENSPISVEITK